MFTGKSEVPFMKLDFALGQVQQRHGGAEAGTGDGNGDGGNLLSGRCDGVGGSQRPYNINIIEDVCENVGIQSFIILVTSFILLVFA